ncbi:MAG: DUF3842 family protein [Clostridia bacterium]
MEIAVIDAQGAGIGKTVIMEIRKAFGGKVTIVALGTNPVACRNMVESGADLGFHQEKELIDYLRGGTMDCLIGPVGILSSGGILGEITPQLSRLVFGADCRKYIIPLNLHGIFIPGTQDLKIKDSLLMIIRDIQETFLNFP